MKDSGIEWIGEIPDNWELKKLKYIATSFSKGNGITKEQIIENGDTPCVRYGDIYSKYSYNFSECKVRTNYQIIESPKYFSYGDILFTCTGELIEEIGKSIAYTGKEKCLAGGDIFIAKHNENPIFMGYALDSFYIQNQKSFGKAKLKVVHISTGEIQNLFLCLPPLNIQKRIADFLDSKCSKIDSLKNDITKQIETLEQYKKSVITEAVTKGINPDVIMKDSGIEWIGEIPEPWEVKPLGHILSERVEKNYPIKTDVILSLSIDIGITLYSEKTTNLDRFKDDITGYKLAHEGDLVLNSMNVISGAEGISAYYGCVSPVYYVLYDNEKENHYCARFYDYHFKTLTLRKYLFSIGKGILAIDRGEGRVNTCRLKVSNYDLKHLHFPVPPKNEIETIVRYLDTKCNRIDSIVESKRHQLEILEDYKKSLIYEYVTGKKQVEE